MTISGIVPGGVAHRTAQLAVNDVLLKVTFILDPLESSRCLCFTILVFDLLSAWLDGSMDRLMKIPCYIPTTSSVWIALVTAVIP